MKLRKCDEYIWVMGYYGFYWPFIRDKHTAERFDNRLMRRTRKQCWDEFMEAFAVANYGTHAYAIKCGYKPMKIKLEPAK